MIVEQLQRIATALETIASRVAREHEHAKLKLKLEIMGNAFLAAKEAEANGDASAEEVTAYHKDMLEAEEELEAFEFAHPEFAQRSAEAVS